MELMLFANAHNNGHEIKLGSFDPARRGVFKYFICEASFFVVDLLQNWRKIGIQNNPFYSDPF
jgi:hypothetical protein